MLSLVLQVPAALALLYFGGEALVRGASALALKAGVSQLAIGLSVVAFGTSAPELVVSLDAALSGANDISVGNVVGSNIANIALILGLAALIRPLAVQAKVVRFDVPIMILASVAMVAVLADGATTRLEGAAMILCLAGYIAYTYLQSKGETKEVHAELASAGISKIVGVLKALVFVLAGLGMVTAGGHLLVESAVALAASLGIGQAAIGLTIVAVGTSLPELATSMVAVMRGQNDIAVGNVVGSNIFNILGILGLTAIVRPLHLGEITWIDLGAMVALSMALLPIALSHHRIGRGEGVLLLICFVAYTAFLLAF